MYGHPGQTENDTSEFIDICQPDLAAYMRHLPTPTLAPPPGRTWQQVSDAVAERLQRTAKQNCASTGLNRQATGLRDDVLSEAKDYWLNQAHLLHRAGRDAAALAAARHFADFVAAEDALGVLAGPGWKELEHAGRVGDWKALEYEWVVNSPYSPPQPGTATGTATTSADPR